MSLRDKICLLIDDDDDFRMIVRRILENLGMSVKEASTVHIAFKIIENWIPHLIILDLNLDKVDGFTFIEQKNANPKIANIPIVVCSAHSLKKNVLKVTQLGASGFIAKPIKQSLLIQKIRQVLRSKEVESYIFRDSDNTVINIKTKSDLVKINENFCVLTSGVKFNEPIKIQIESNLFKKFDINCNAIESIGPSRILNPGEYETTFTMLGISDKSAQNIRTLRNNWINNEG
ncbi:MAG: response regulator [Oligoflexia bacterium]|nr:response regulator [Oligoflexia bacterium]